LHNQLVFITNFTQLSELKPKTFNSCENEVAKGKISTSHRLSITPTYTMNISYPFPVLQSDWTALMVTVGQICVWA